MLAHSPPLPLVIDYFKGNEDPNMTAEDEEGIFLALEQPNRIRGIRVGLYFRDLRKFVMAIDDELPILEYLVLATGGQDYTTLVIPDRIQAPHLRHLALVGGRGNPPQIGSRLLTTAVGLVTLCLFMGGYSTYLNPISLLQWISSLPQLETLAITTTFPSFDEQKRLSHKPTITHATVTLPNLRLLSFDGFSPYLEELIRQIATPRLERLHILFFGPFASSFPCLVRFMNTTENKGLRFDSAKLEFSDDQVRVETHPHVSEENRQCSFSIGIECSGINEHIYSLAQNIDALGQVFSAVDHLILDYDEDCAFEYELGFGLAVDRTIWHNLLSPFSNVKYLRVNHRMVEGFSRYLRLDDGELPPGLLPELQELTYSGSTNSGDPFTSFIDARQNHPVSLVSLSPNPT